jgi:membrane protein involved in colicin uptake
LQQQESSRSEALERQRRDAEREAREASERADAALRRAAPQAPAIAETVAQAGSDVRQRCSASANVFSEALCHSRECRNPDNANDAICIRIREIDEARRRVGQ